MNANRTWKEQFKYEEYQISLLKKLNKDKLINLSSENQLLFRGGRLQKVGSNKGLTMMASKHSFGNKSIIEPRFQSQLTNQLKNGFKSTPTSPMNEMVKDEIN